MALAAARRDPPDLILLDINMPEMNGYEVCEQLKADDKLKGIPVIFISALTEPLDKVKAFATGGVDYITKPFQMEELHARVETHLKLRGLQVELEAANARLAAANGRMSRDLRAAARIQATFLPGEMTRVPGADFAWAYRPCDELAGDGLNVVPLGGGRVGLYVLDVSGHGVAPALLSVTLSRLLSPPSDPSSILVGGGDRGGRSNVTPPAEVAARLNRSSRSTRRPSSSPRWPMGSWTPRPGSSATSPPGTRARSTYRPAATRWSWRAGGFRSAWPTRGIPSAPFAWRPAIGCTCTPTGSPRR